MPQAAKKNRPSNGNSLTPDPNIRPFGSRGTSSNSARAGWLMVGIGVLMLLGGAVFIAGGFLITIDQFPAEQAKKLHEIESQFPGMIKVVYVTVGCLVVLTGIYHLVMGYFVRRGNRGAIYTVIVSSFLALFFCAIYMAAGVFMGGSDAAGGVCFLVVIGSVFVWLLLWLFNALRSPMSPAAVAQYQAQYWQMLQQQQAYGQPQGMGVPPPPTGVLAPPPPPQPPSPEPSGWAYGSQSPPPPPNPK